MLPRVCWGMYGCRLVAFNNGFYLVDNLLATLAVHLGIHADGDHVFVGRVAFEVDGGGVFAEGLHTPRLRFLFLLISSSSSMVSYFGSARSCISSPE